MPEIGGSGRQVPVSEQHPSVARVADIDRFQPGRVRDHEEHAALVSNATGQEAERLRRDQLLGAPGPARVNVGEGSAVGSMSHVGEGSLAGDGLGQPVRRADPETIGEVRRRTREIDEQGRPRPLRGGPGQLRSGPSRSGRLGRPHRDSDHPASVRPGVDQLLCPIPNAHDRGSLRVLLQRLRRGSELEPSPLSTSCGSA